MRTPMNCCNHCVDAGDFFDQKKAEKELRKYRKKGLSNKSTRLLIDALKRQNLQERTLLDVGGGVGMIPYELMERGLAHATLVEASPSYLEVAQDEADRRGYGNRLSFNYGDFVELAPDIPQMDLVTLDRVICCYPHMQQLVDVSCRKANKWYGVVYPKERWYIDIGLRLANLYCRVRGMEFRVYLHTGVDEAIREQGFTPVYEDETILWRVGLYERNG